RLAMFRISQLVLAAGRFAAADRGVALDLSGPVPPGGRPNRYGLSPEEFEASRRNGLLQALTWPDVDYGLTLPYPALDRSVRLVNTLPAAKLLLEAIGLARFGTTWEEMYAGLGLSPYPAREGE